MYGLHAGNQASLLWCVFRLSGHDKCEHHAGVCVSLSQWYGCGTTHTRLLTGRGSRPRVQIKPSCMQIVFKLCALCQVVVLAVTRVTEAPRLGSC